jgi:hypothetical protein
MTTPGVRGSFAQWNGLSPPPQALLAPSWALLRGCSSNWPETCLDGAKSVGGAAFTSASKEAKMKKVLPEKLELYRRTSDGSLWAKGHTENRSIGGEHFFRVRRWRGKLVAAPRVFWRPVNEVPQPAGNEKGLVLGRWQDEDIWLVTRGLVPVNVERAGAV